MENLVLRHNKRPIVRGIMIIVFVLFVVLSYLFISRPLDIWDILNVVFFALMYMSILLYLTSPCGIKITDEGLKIKWFQWLKAKSITDPEVEKIVLGRLYIKIFRKNTKPVKLILEPLEKDGKTKVYEFFIEYSKLKNLVLERDLSA